MRKPTGYCYKCGKKNDVPIWITCNDCSRPKNIKPIKLEPPKIVITPKHLRFGNFNPDYRFEMKFVKDRFFTYQSTMLKNEIESRNDIKRIVVDNINRIIGFQV
jgi:hypothetical protein